MKLRPLFFALSLTAYLPTSLAQTLEQRVQNLEREVSVLKQGGGNPGPSDCVNFEPSGIVPAYTQLIVRTSNGHWGYSGEYLNMTYEFQTRSNFVDSQGRQITVARVNQMGSNPGCQFHTFFSRDLVFYATSASSINQSN